MKFVKTPLLLLFLFRKYLWKFKTTQKKVYLTFDDGPIPAVTEWVLEILKQENCKATFFCIGDNIQKHPDVFQQIITNKHRIGNHTFNHLNGWNTDTKTYLENIKKCQEKIESFGVSTHLFRPPYGKIKPKQATQLLKNGYQIVCWDVLTYDFDKTIRSEKTYSKILKSIEKGSIIVFHDSLKAEKNLRMMLPKLIFDLKKQGYLFESF